MIAPRSPVRALAAFDLKGWSLARGIRGALGCCVPLLAAQRYGNPALSWAALIGFWVALVDPGWPPRSRLLTIGGFTAASAVGCVVAVLLRPYLWPSGVCALVWCFVAILTRVWGDTAGGAGNLTALATLIVLGADQPSSTAAAAEMAAFTVGGGLWGLLLAFGIGPRRPEAPLRTALVAVFKEEAAFVRDLARAGPPQQRRGAVREAIENARLRLVSAHGRGFGGNAAVQRFTLLLSDAEGALLALLALREALNDAEPAEAPQAALNALADRMDAAAAALSDDQRVPVIAVSAALADEVAAAAVHTVTGWIGAAERHMTGSAEWVGPTGDAGLVQSDHCLRKLRDNLTTGSLSLRHAARFVLTGAALTMLTKGLRIEMGYWITITAVIILQAFPSATWQRAIQRVGGTLLGGLIAAGASFVLHGPAAIVIVVIPLSLLSMAFRGVSYALYIVCITPLFILITELINRDGVLSPALGGLRMLDNVVGAAFGMLATFVLWPSWEAHFLRHHLAVDLRGNPRFLLTAVDAWLGKATMREADNARRQAGLAGNNAEASLRRALEEPRRYPPDQIAAAMAITAAARRLAGMAALIMQSPPIPEAMAHRRHASESLGKIRGCRGCDRARKIAARGARHGAARPFVDRGLGVWSLAAAQRGD
jgi:uncharacterized membrane protein YccC